MSAAPALCAISIGWPWQHGYRHRRRLRLPGFRNHKYETPHYVVEIPSNPPPYRLRPLDFPVFPAEPAPQATEFGHDPPVARQISHTTRRANGTGLSRTGRLRSARTPL
jgi:hypothetical protein